ncbi:MAG: UDP-3-O-(3-hydroxymyristoyl)glucosamine N-acyltransferase, partial [Draconibacterium sp.]|nr:UDP-3-O-(3-hydroxymyristoyl)glucosamine N-acyltransferase [Draconibacterium sp.]
FEPKEAIKATLIKVDDAYQAFASLLDLYMQAKAAIKIGVEQPNYVSETAKVGEDIYLGAFSYVGNNSKVGNNVKLYPQVHVGDNVTIGDNCILYAGVKIYDDCVIGNNCIIHAGTVVGSDGFGFAPQENGEYKKIHQIGNVIIEDDVEIGANCSIDCGTMNSTIIRKGVKLDNLIQIAHNVEVGEHTVMAAQTGIAGSTKIGKNCMFGGQVGIVGHLNIGNKVSIGAQAGIAKNINDGETVFGTPAQPIKDFMRAFAVFKRLPDLQREVLHIQKEIKSNKES